MTLGAIPASVTRITGDYRRQIAAAARQEYENGATVEDIATLLDRPYSLARRLLLESGTTLRSSTDPSVTRRPRDTSPDTPDTGDSFPAVPASPATTEDTLDLAELLLANTAPGNLTLTYTALSRAWRAAHSYPDNADRLSQAIAELRQRGLITTSPSSGSRAATITVLNRNVLRSYSLQEPPRTPPTTQAWDEPHHEQAISRR